MLSPLYFYVVLGWMEVVLGWSEGYMKYENIFHAVSFIFLWGARLDGGGTRLKWRVYEILWKYISSSLLYIYMWC